MLRNHSSSELGGLDQFDMLYKCQILMHIQPLWMIVNYCTQGLPSFIYAFKSPWEVFRIGPRCYQLHRCLYVWGGHGGGTLGHFGPRGLMTRAGFRTCSPTEDELHSRKRVFRQVVSGLIAGARVQSGPVHGQGGLESQPVLQAPNILKNEGILNQG